jgi:macrolide transport system ATP-binding/permease protein
MSPLRRLWNLLRRSRLDDDLRQELETHLALIEEEELRGGFSAKQAQQQARIRFGSPLSYRERALDAVTVRWIADAWKDARFAVRQLRKARAFTAVAVISLALGIGANAAIFTLIDAVLLKSLPVRDPGGLFLLGNAQGRGVAVGQIGRSFVLYSYDLYEHLRDAEVFDGLCAFQSANDRVSVHHGGSIAAQPAIARLVSGNYFQLLGVNAAVGRTIVPSDDAASVHPVAVVSFSYWTGTLNQDPAAVGATVDLNGVAVAIVGVAPPEFYGETIEPDPPSFWLPISAARELKRGGNLIDEPGRHWLYLMGRLRPDVTVARAEARLTLTLQNWLLARQGSTTSAERRAAIANSRVELTSAARGVPHMQRSYTHALRLLLGISMAVLLIACANIAGLLLARGMARRPERAVRLALGATRGRLMRQSLTESLTLALAGGALSLLVAAAAARLLVAMVFRGADYVPIQTMPGASVLAFTFTLSCGAALASGLVPAIDMHAGIAPGMRGARFRLGKALIIGEAAVSLMVLAGAGSLAHSLANLNGQQFGFERTRLLVVSVDTRLGQYGYSRLGPLYQQLLSRLNSLPGVKSASLSYYSPFNGCCWAFTVAVPGYRPRTDDEMSVVLNRVSPRYFETLGTKVLRGRAFDEHDTATSRRVVVVTDAFVQRYFRNGDPIGRSFNLDSEGPDVPLEIVGVVEDAKYDEPREGLRPMAFLPLLQMKPGESEATSEYQSNFISAIEVRPAGDPAEIARPVRHVLAEIDPGLPVLRVETVSERIGEALSQEKIVATLAAIFALLALLLTSVGLYGLMTYLVQRRTSEIGIRMALGARRGAVIGMVIREALEQATAGIIVGIPIAMAGVRLIASQLYGVSPTNPHYAGAAALVLMACLAVAGYLPAQRASQIDAIRALRQE